jgi:DNA modification methylase
MLGEQGFNTNADNYWEGWEPIRSYLTASGRRCGWSITEGFESNRRTTKMRESLVRPEPMGMHRRKRHYRKWQEAAKDHALCDQAKTVVDPFAGTGTTTIVAEQMGRRSFGMEIDPTYCDVIVKRFENLTGEEAIRWDN